MILFAHDLRSVQVRDVRSSERTSRTCTAEVMDSKHQYSACRDSASKSYESIFQGAFIELSEYIIDMKNG